MHFMNPVPVMKLVEVIRGEKTDDATNDAVVAACETLGKTPCVLPGLPRLRRQSHPHADDQRGLLRPHGRRRDP